MKNLNKLPSFWKPFWHLKSDLESELSVAAAEFGGTVVELDGERVCKMPSPTVKDDNNYQTYNHDLLCL